MKRSPTPLRIPGPSIEYGYNRDIPGSRGQSQSSQYLHSVHPQSVITASHRSRDADTNSFQYLPDPDFGFEYRNGQMRYPESSQRTVCDDVKPCISAHIPENAPPTFLGRDAKPLLPQNSLLPLVAQADPYSTVSHDLPHLGNIPPYPYDKTLPESLRAPSSPHMMTVQRTLVPQKLPLTSWYGSSEAQMDSGVSVDRYINLDANPTHESGSRNHPPITSSIPMSNGPDWSVASTLGTCDQSGQSSISHSTILVNDLTQPTHDEATSTSSSSPVNDVTTFVKKKKVSKMHRCEVCGKMFPRPSGLKTHMNTHNNLKPFPCSFEGCSRSFTVRSNAKRHLRTHGVETTVSRLMPTAPYSVGFDTPNVLPPPATTHEMVKVPYKLRWMPPSLSSRTNAANLRSVSDDESSDDESDCMTVQDNQGLGGEQPRLPISLPCRPVVPSSVGQIFEERNSYLDAPRYPYHPTQFRILPGPAMAQPLPASVA